MPGLILNIFLWFQLNGFSGSERILLLGDSHMVGHFGEHFHKRLHELGKYEVLSIGIGGAGSVHYTLPMKNFCCGYKIRHTKTGDSILPKMQVPRIEFGTTQTGEVVGKAWSGKLENLLIDYSPDLVILFLGSNYANNHSGLLQIIQKRTPLAKIIWIGPFKRVNLDSRLHAIKKANTNGEVFTFIPGHDIAGHDTLTTFHLSDYSAKKAVGKLIPRLIHVLDSLITP
jgi:hypothetical protein